MNRPTTSEAIKVMQAYIDGKTIQGRPHSLGWQTEKAPWEDLAWDPAWDWKVYEYRIKPDKPRERWIVTDGAGNETLYFHDPRAKLVVFESAAKFVEVIAEDTQAAHKAGFTPKTIVPPSVRPLLRPFKKGDKGKTVGGWLYVVRDVAFDGYLYVEHDDGGFTKPPTAEVRNDSFERWRRRSLRTGPSVAGT